MIWHFFEQVDVMSSVCEIAERVEMLYWDAARERERREELECALRELHALLEQKPRWFRCLWYAVVLRRVREVVDEVLGQAYA